MQMAALGMARNRIMFYIERESKFHVSRFRGDYRLLAVLPCDATVR